MKLMTMIYKKAYEALIKEKSGTDLVFKLKEGSVTGDKIADGAVTTSKLSDGAVTSEKLANESVGTGKLEDNAVTSDKIAEGAVGEHEIADGSITEVKLDDKVRAKLNNETEAISVSVKRAPSGNWYIPEEDNDTFDNLVEAINKGEEVIYKLSAQEYKGLDYVFTSPSVIRDHDGAIAITASLYSYQDPLNTERLEEILTLLHRKKGGVEIGFTDIFREDSVDTVHIKDGAITTSKIADDSVTELELADNSVSTSKIKDNAVTKEKIVDNSISTSKLDDKAVITSKIDDLAVTSEKLDNGSVTTGKLDDNAVTTEKIANGAVGEQELDDGSVTTLKLSDNSVTTAKLMNKSVTKEKLADGSIDASKLDSSVIDSLDKTKFVTLSGFDTSVKGTHIILTSDVKLSEMVSWLKDNYTLVFKVHDSNKDVDYTVSDYVITGPTLTKTSLDSTDRLIFDFILSEGSGIGHVLFTGNDVILGAVSEMSDLLSNSSVDEAKLSSGVQEKLSKADKLVYTDDGKISSTVLPEMKLGYGLQKEDDGTLSLIEDIPNKRDVEMAIHDSKIGSYDEYDLAVKVSYTPSGEGDELQVTVTDVFNNSRTGTVKMPSLSQFIGIVHPDTTDYSNYFCHTSITKSEGMVSPKATSLYSMYFGCHNLTSINMDDWDTSNVTTMESMFAHDHSLTSIDLSRLNVNNVTNMEAMFFDCTSLTTVDLSTWELNSDVVLTRMFDSCDKLETVYVRQEDLEKWQTVGTTGIVNEEAFRVKE